MFPQVLEISCLIQLKSWTSFKSINLAFQYFLGIKWDKMCKIPGSYHQVLALSPRILSSCTFPRSPDFRRQCNVFRIYYGYRADRSLWSRLFVLLFQHFHALQSSCVNHQESLKPECNGIASSAFSLKYRLLAFSISDSVIKHFFSEIMDLVFDLVRSNGVSIH